MPDLVLAGSEDGHVVVDDGVLRSGRTQLQHDPSFFGASEFGFVDVVPAITFVILNNQIWYTVKLGYNELGYNELGYNELGDNELGYNEHSVITNEYFGPNWSLTTQINPLITNPGYNKRIRPVPSYNRVSLYFG